VSPEASGDKFKGKIMEVVCVRCLQHDKKEGKIVVVDYEIPPKSEWQTVRKKNL
jgi:hypothetical protein